MIKVGDTVLNGVLSEFIEVETAGCALGPNNFNVSDIVKGKKIAVFGLPGAFTPTCSSKHLPRYNELAGVLKANGVDSVVCLAVNDPFVMATWKAEENADNIDFLPDGNGEFSAGMGLLVDKSETGLGKRSWRYSMLVKDGLIEKMFIEPEEPGDPFKVSDADTMLNYISPKASPPPRVTFFSKPGCPHCARQSVIRAGNRVRYCSARPTLVSP